MRLLPATAVLILGAGLGSLPLRGAFAANPPPPPSNGWTVVAAPASTAVPSFTRAGTVSGSTIVQYAMRYLGYPYTATGNSPSTGFSCIGFVSYVYRSLGINLPGDLGGALAFAPRVAFSNLLPGDILYFQNTVWSGLSHAAIYIGGGKFVHAEWYNRGVVTSSFTGDPVDYNYWTAHYLGANRPWTGAVTRAVSAAPAPQATVVATRVPSVPPVPVVTPVAIPTPRAVPGAVHAQLPAGPSAAVRVSSLNVRSGPSIRASVYTVIVRGTRVVILGARNGWCRVALPSGTIGWVIGAGIGKGSTGNGGGQPSRPQAPTAGQSRPAAPQPTSTTPWVPPGRFHRRIAARTTSPARVAPRLTARKSLGVATRRTVSVRVAGLRVHAAPSLAAAVLGVAGPQRRLPVLRSSGRWVQVRLASGTVGWISRSYAARAGSASTRRAAAPWVSTGRRATVALNIRVDSSPASAIVGVLSAGSAYRVLGWSPGWAHVRLATGMTGWISGTVLHPPTTSLGSTSTTHPAFTVSRSTTARSTVTAGVRLRTRPGLKSATLRLVAVGTRVQVLRSAGNWTAVRLPSHQVGYVLAMYVSR